MRVDFSSPKPVYIQIAEGMEDDIISGRLAEGGAAYSQQTIAKELGVNPATAAKGINSLVAKGILEKQRGTSMVVSAGALDTIIKERRETKFCELVKNLVAEAKKIKLTEEEVVAEIKRHYTIPGAEKKITFQHDLRLLTTENID